MTALDQAFIKAYKQLGPAGQSTPAGAPGHAADDKSADVKTPSASTPPASVQADPSQKNEAEVLAFAPPPCKPAGKSKSTRKRGKKTSKATAPEKFNAAEAVYRLDPPSPTFPHAPRASSFTSPAQEKRLPESDSNAPPDDVDNCLSDPPVQTYAPDTNSSDKGKKLRFDCPVQDALPPSRATELPAGGFYPEAPIRVFQPMLQVDHFVWPNVCHRLESIAPLELDRMAETLLASRKQGKNVLGICGAERGVGATTLLLCAARRLAARNAKTVVVDGDFGEPQLAKRLGLMPQLGWEDVAAGRQPVEEVLIESAADNLTILPLCRPLVVSNISYASQKLMTQSLATLRNNYDLVLMDLGPLENPQSLTSVTEKGLNCRIDAVIVVHKHGNIFHTYLPAIHKSLATAGIIFAGVIENFVQNPVTSDS